MTITIPSEHAFKREFLEAPELERMAQTVIRQHAELAFLLDWDIRCLWKREGSGKEAMGRCRVLTGELAYFADADWLIWVAADIARDSLFGDHEVEALLFHELLHCELKGKEGQEKPATRGHDFEAFAIEVERYGAWDVSLRRAHTAFRQLELGLAVPEAPGPGAPVASALRTAGRLGPKGRTWGASSETTVTLEAAGRSVTLRPGDMDGLVDRLTGEIRAAGHVPESQQCGLMHTGDDAPCARDAFACDLPAAEVEP